jgi:hypothetical protein
MPSGIWKFDFTVEATKCDRFETKKKEEHLKSKENEYLH